MPKKTSKLPTTKISNSGSSPDDLSQLTLGFERLQVCHEENSPSEPHTTLRDAELGKENYSNNFLHAPMDFVPPNRTEFIADID